MGKLGEKVEHKGRILAVGIAYHKDDKTKRHECKVEVLRDKNEYYYQCMYKYNLID